MKLKDTPRKESYDKARQPIKSRDITLPTKVCLVNAMVFPVVMYGCESWTVKKAEHRRINWRFWTVVVEKTLESPLDCKKIKPVNPKGNQPWTFIGRTDAEGRRRRGWQRTKWLDGITNYIMDMSQQPHGLQHPRFPCPSLSPVACSNSCPSSRWCLPTISSSVVPFSSCPQLFPASQCFLVSQFFSSGGNIWASTSASILPMNMQDWLPLGLTGLISLQSKGLSTVFSSTTVQKHTFFGAQPSLWSNSHIHTWLLEKTIALTTETFVGKVMSLWFSIFCLGWS